MFTGRLVVFNNQIMKSKTFAQCTSIALSAIALVLWNIKPCPVGFAWGLNVVSVFFLGLSISND